MATYTPEEAFQALERFPGVLDRFLLTAVQDGMNEAAKISATEFIVGSSGGSRDPFVDPPNPPPGPLKARSGDLRRGLSVPPVEKRGETFIGSLENDVVYAAIHEFGGTTPAHLIEPREADALAFVGRDGTLVFREFVIHPGSHIPARPFMLPAITKAVPIIEDFCLQAGLEAINTVLP